MLTCRQILTRHAVCLADALWASRLGDCFKRVQCHPQASPSESTKILEGFKQIDDSLIIAGSKAWCRSYHSSRYSMDENSPGRTEPVPNVVPSFPPTSAGGIILGPIDCPDVKEFEKTRRVLNAAIFDHHYQEGNRRTGRKQMGRMLKGDFVADYYLTKNTDPLLVNVQGQEEAEKRALRNARGFKRRRPQKKDKAKAKPSGRK